MYPLILTASLLREFFTLWGHTQSLQLNSTQEDQIIWILESSGEYSARSAYTIQFSGQMLSNFAKLVWATMQNFPLATLLEQGLDHGETATAGVEKQLFLCPVREKSGDLRSSIHLVPLLKESMGASSIVEQLCQPTPN
jgi:hypothetical protein